MAARAPRRAAEAAETRRGYQVFLRDASMPVFPESEPSPDEAGTVLAAFAARGETRTLTVALHPLKDLGEVRVTVSDLKCGWWHRIPASAWEVGVGRYLECRTSEAGYGYEVRPRVIQPRNPTPIPRGMSARWWLRVSVPADAPAGEYRGEVRFEAEKGKGFSLPIRLQVLPFRLTPLPILAGLYHFDYVYWYPCFWQRTFGDDAWLRERTIEHERQNARLLQRFGINALSLTGEDLRNDAHYEGDRLVIRDDGPFSRWMDAYASMGMKAMPWYGFSSVASTCLPEGNFGRKAPWLSPEWERGLATVTAWLKEQEKTRGWPEVILYASDELSNEGAAGAERGMKLLGALNRVRGERPWRTLASVNGPYERALVPLLSIVMPNHAYPITSQSLDEVRQNKAELWVYNLGTDRATWGFYPWAVGARGRFQWFNCQISGDPWNCFTCDSPFTVTRTTPGEPLPSPELFEIGEGLNDLRYLATLEKRVAEAAASARAGAREASAAAHGVLDELRRSVPVDPRAIIGEVEAQAAGAAAKGEWASHAVLDRKRWRVAEAILRLQDSMGGPRDD